MIYRTHWGSAIVLLLVAVPLSLAGMLAFVATLGHDIGLTLACAGFTAFFSLFVWAGLNLVYRFYRVDEVGVSLQEGYGYRCDRFLWQDVERWVIWPENESTFGPLWQSICPEERRVFRPSMEGRGILLRIRDRKIPFFIGETDVCVPSFQRFLEDLREEIGDRELRVTAGKIAASQPVPAVETTTAVQAAVTAIEPTSPNIDSR